MTARIFQEPKSAMQSGRARAGQWVLEFDRSERQRPDPLTGWAGSSDTRTQLRLAFPTLEAAQGYAAREGIDATVFRTAARTLRLQTYADNFR